MGFLAASQVKRRAGGGLICLLEFQLSKHKFYLDSSAEWPAESTKLACRGKSSTGSACQTAAVLNVSSDTQVHVTPNGAAQ
jgi:hypothetical protein